MGGWKIERLDVATADEVRLRAAHAVEAAIDAETLPDDPSPFEMWLARWQHTPSWERKHTWLAVAEDDDEQVLAIARVRFSDVDNRDLGWGWIGVSQAHRRRGVATSLLRTITATCVADGRQMLSMSLLRGHGGEGFLGRHGFDERMVGHQNRTRVKEIDRALLETWVAERHQRAAEYELVAWEGPTPAELVDRFSAARAIMNTAPLEDLEMEDEVMTPEMQAELDQVAIAQGLEWRTLAALGPDGAIAGYTQMFFSRWRPDVGYQEDTGVDPAHRNRGIGRWLKAAMLLHVLDQRPEVEVVRTGNAGSNAPMLSINRALGFRPAVEWAVWQARVERVVKELEAAEKA